ncbi:MAG: hypothetical protein AB7P69_23430 [Candidatus Binatia bacterium]
MKRCLPKRALLLCAAGEGTNEQLLHVAACNSCQERYLRFIRDLETIEHVLRTTTPPRTTVATNVLRPNPWLSLAAAAAMLVILVWGAWRFQQPSESALVSNSVKQEDIVQFLQDEVSPAVFPMTERREFVVPAPVSDERYLEAALNDGWPCEWQDAAFTPTCEFYPFSLTFVEQ